MSNQEQVNSINSALQTIANALGSTVPLADPEPNEPFDPRSGRRNQAVMWMEESNRFWFTYDVGFSTCGIPVNKCFEVCCKAIRYGYRHFDMDLLSPNAVEVGRALRRMIDLGESRDKFFISARMDCSVGGAIPQTEVPGNANFDVMMIKSRIEKVFWGSCGNHVDILLIDGPVRSFEDRLTLWLALEILWKQKSTRFIGVCNWNQEQIEQIVRSFMTSDLVPAVNQLELNPWNRQPTLIHYLTGVRHPCPIGITAHTVLGGGQFNEAIVNDIADVHNTTPALVLIRYSLEKGWRPIVKTIRGYRMRENREWNTFTLTEEEMELLDSLNEHDTLQNHNEMIIR